jgi:4-hydroxy-tetrahydrodipicolinate synthase
MAEPIEGVCPIIATPFTPDDELDYGSLRREVRTLARGGCHAATLFGIAGEFYKLADDERDQIVEVVTEVAGAEGLPLVVSVTDRATTVAVERAESYADAGADCLMVYPPRFRDPATEGVLDHVRAIGEAVDVPVMVQHTEMNVSVAPEEWATVHDDAPNVRYFKIETSPPGPYIESLQAAADVDALVGAAGTGMIEAYDRGAVGVMPAASVFEVYLEIHEALRAGERERALDAHGAMLELQNQVVESGIRSEKWVLAERGIIDHPTCRAPAPPAFDEAHERLLATHLDRLGSYL